MDTASLVITTEYQLSLSSLSCWVLCITMIAITNTVVTMVQSLYFYTHYRDVLVCDLLSSSVNICGSTAWPDVPSSNPGSSLLC